MNACTAVVQIGNFQNLKFLDNDNENHLFISARKRKQQKVQKSKFIKSPQFRLN